MQDSALYNMHAIYFQEIAQLSLALTDNAESIFFPSVCKNCGNTWKGLFVWDTAGKTAFSGGPFLSMHVKQDTQLIVLQAPQQAHVMKRKPWRLTMKIPRQTLGPSQGLTVIEF